MPNLALSLDLGTTSISAAAVDQDGRLAAHVQVPNNATVRGLPPGHAEQHPQQLLTVTLSVLHPLAERLPGMPHCLALTGPMHGGLLVDAGRHDPRLRGPCRQFNTAAEDGNRGTRRSQSGGRSGPRFR